MMLLEHDAKSLLAPFGVACPTGWRAAAATFEPPAESAGPWVVKAQVPVGGRGKAGGIAVVQNAVEAQETLDRILGMTIKGHKVGFCRIEEATIGNEVYLAMRLDSYAGRILCLFSENGGVEIESNADSLFHAQADFDPSSVARAFADIVHRSGATQPAAILAAAKAVSDAFFALEAPLIEINPLLIGADGSWTAADAKVVVDLNALPRQSALRTLIETHPGNYPEATVKLVQGFDMVVLDPDGEIGMLTTGAGLSMQIADELFRNGHSVFNFTDVRSGGLRGDPQRLIYIFQALKDSSSVKAALVNIFAGITHLEEFSKLLLQALEAVPGFDIPLVARLVGNGEDEGAAVLADTPFEIHFERDLDRALAKVVKLAEGRA